MAVGRFFSLQPRLSKTAQNFIFRFINYFIQPSRVGSLIPAFLDSQTGLNRKLKQGSVAWCSSKCGQSAVQRWACSFRVRQAARTDHRIGDTELRRTGGRSEKLWGECQSNKGKVFGLTTAKIWGEIVWHAALEYDRQHEPIIGLATLNYEGLVEGSKI